MALHQRRALTVGEKHGLVHEDVEEARQAAAGAMERSALGAAEHRRARVPGDRHAMGDVGADFLLGEAVEAMLEHDALAHLADGRRLELAVELRLAEEHYLHKL